jgi:O-antigen/teichoic acid export membrane protein
VESILSKIKTKIIESIRLLNSKGFFHLLSANFLTQFLGFGTLLLVTKLVSPTEIGEIKVIQSYVAIFIILAGFGFNTAVLKYCAEDIGKQEKERILKYSVKYSAYTTIFSYILLVILAANGVIGSSRNISYWLMVYGAVLPFMVMTNLGMIYLQAIKQIKRMAKVQSLVKLQSFVVIIISTYLWGFKGFIMATIVAYFIGVIPILREIGIDFLKEKPLKTKGFFSMAIFSMLANGVSLLGQYGDIFILDKFCMEKEQLGFYSLATIFLTGAVQVTGVVQSIITPYFSAHCQDKKWVYSYLIKNQLKMIILSIIVAIGTYIFCYFFVPYFYGEQYRSVLTYLEILLLKYIVYSSYALIGAVLVGLGLTNYNLLVVAITTPISLILSYFFLQNHGIIGVAYSQLISACIILGMVLIISRIALKRYFKTI